MAPDHWRSLLRRLVREHVRGLTGKLTIAMIAMVLVAATTAGNAWLIEPVLDKVFLERDTTMLALVPLAVVALALVKGIASFFQDRMMADAGNRIVADVQARLFDHTIRSDLGFFVSEGTGGLISRITYDVASLRVAMTSVLTGMARDGLSVVFLVALMFYQDWKLASIAFIGFPLAYWPISKLGKRVRKVVAQAQAQMGRITGRLEQTFQGVRQVKAYDREAFEIDRVRQLIEGQYALQLKAARIRAATSPVMETLAGIAIAAVIGYGGSQVLAGQTTPGTFFSFITALLMAYQPLKSIAKLNNALQEGLAAADRVYAVIDRPPAIEDAPDAMVLPAVAGHIQYLDVRFAYHSQVPAIAGLNLDVPAGQTVALVGPSGSGKSTLVNLLFRFWDIQSGRITLDGYDIRHVTQASLRAQMALVSQEVSLFDDTVRANIAYGRLDATDAEIQAAARDAAAHDFIMALPEGYETRIGGSGVRLSGGQRQRLSIARAMLKKAPILLLDEATSALDTESERQIQDALARLMKNRTTLVIAHRLSTVVHADKIAVLDKGRIVEMGDHASLLRAGGTYARLYQLQFEEGSGVDLPGVAVPALLKA
ncbi:MAG TPA: ABC transporter ATP-binding protein [Geminicoccus sp.]|uniref:ABC transporter ATP-binding protein n=1 Tax=Geminicoccus sp. TaxID=2024832 RepID=UPI002E2EC086|nr:ABC transporter ATP-binding protein [Geminicoccus sp.]HEX2526527.1 ABC transporter ATP-binding protein [Geminicoccus sp.]